MFQGVLDLVTGTEHPELNADTALAHMTDFAAAYATVTAGDDSGIWWYHSRPGGKGQCSGSVGFQGRDSDGKWTVVQEDPLTLSPSLNCTACGRHGYIENGRWRDC